MAYATDVSLRQLSTMGLGGRAAHVTSVENQTDLVKAVHWAKENGNLPMIMIGEGSNIIWRDEGFAGLVIVNKIRGFRVLRQNDDPNVVHVVVGGGEIWDDVVRHAVEAGYSGIECLSLIPGTAGAAPVQNVGAYGQDISEVLVSIEAFDTSSSTSIRIPTSECGFGYRKSRFNTTDSGRFFITQITIRLAAATNEPVRPPLLATLQSYLSEHNATEYTAQIVRDAVIEIRRAKLPSPDVVRNCGSFFTNPVVPNCLARELELAHDEGMPVWPAGDDGLSKISAAWLIDRAGFRDYHDSETGMATWRAQPLVLVNEHAASTADLLRFEEKIVVAVRAKFGVTLVREPVLLPTC